MPRTSTAERNNYRCPLCDQQLARDLDGQGWVRHTERPDVGRLLTDPDKRALMSVEDVRFLEFQGLCPFERGEKDANPPPPLPPRFRHLEPRPGSQYRQWFVKGRKLRALTLHLATLEPEARTPERVADDFDVPLEAVLEAVEYCLHNGDVLEEDFEEEEAAIRSAGVASPARGRTVQEAQATPS